MRPVRSTRRPETKEWLADRICEALREIGVLLMAFAPLDVALKDRAAGDSQALRNLLGAGIFLFVVGLYLESKWRDKHE